MPRQSIRKAAATKATCRKDPKADCSNCNFDPGAVARQSYERR